jgi:hypothetical protein
LGCFLLLYQKNRVLYSDLIIDRDNSNLFVPYVLTFDGKKIECEVSKWHLYGFVKGDHVKWAKNFRKMGFQKSMI